MAAVAKQPTIGAGNQAVETPGQQLQLTPNFFNSIFNDGMNPFDEYFGCSTPGGNTSFLAATLRKEHNLAGDNPRVLKDQMLPAINTKLDQTLTPEQSPKSLAIGESTILQLAISRSPSPLTFTGKLPYSPVSSITPITSPEELTPNVSVATELPKPPTQAEGSPGRTRKSFSVAKSTKSAAHKRNMSLPQDWSSAIKVQSQIPDNIQWQPQNLLLPNGVERQPKPAAMPAIRSAEGPAPHLTSRMDGIFVTENIPVEIKAEPESPVRAGFDPSNRPSSNAGRKRKKSSTGEEEDDDEDTKHLNEAEKRARFLERNRVAASKCRKKKKLMNQRLEEKSRLLVQQNRFLSATLTKLRGDVLRLKQILLTHHDCKHAPIERYLHQEAGRYLAAENAEDVAKKLDVASADSRIAELSGLVSSEEAKIPAAGWLNGFHSFQEVETEALKRTNPILEFDDEAFQKLLLGDQLTMMDDEFGTSPPPPSI